jgi:hypothetical protein
MKPSRLLLLICLFFESLFSKTVYHDWGGPDDFLESAPVFLENYDFTASSFIYAENPTTAEYFPFLLNHIILPNELELIPPGELPNAGAGFIRYRMLKNVYVTRMKIASTYFALDSSGHAVQPLFLKLRYKDTTLNCHIDEEYGPGVYPYKNQGVSLHAWDGAHWPKIGETAGRYDFAWKTVVCTILPKQLQSENGYFDFKLGGDWFCGSSIYGNWLAIDAVTLSDSLLENEPVLPGFWPEVEPSERFQHSAEMGLFVDNEPFFPLGLHVSPYTGTRDLLKNAHAAGFNLVTYDGWNAHKLPGQGTNATWDSFLKTMNGLTYRGLPEFLAAADSTQMKVLVWFSSDATANRIHAIGHPECSEPFLFWTPYDGTFSGWLRTVRTIVHRYRNHPAIWGWFIKDEADHDDESDENDVGASNFPPELARALYQTVHEADPEHPCYLNLMNWKRFTALAYKSTADILGVDKYPELRESLLLARLFYHSGKEIWPKAFMPHIGIFDRETDGFDRMQLQSALALIFGARGLLFFRATHATSAEWWANCQEWITLLDSVARPFFHPQNATELGHRYWDFPNADWYRLPCEASGQGITQSDGVIVVFRENRKTGQRLLLAVNLLEQAQTVRFAPIVALNAGTSVSVLAEKRVIAADDGNFTDHFRPFETHFYLLEPNSSPVRRQPLLQPAGCFGIFPNPVTDWATFRLHLPQADEITLTLFNLLGQEVAQLYAGKVESGEFRVTQLLNQLPAGVYFGKLVTTRDHRITKFVIVH